MVVLRFQVFQRVHEIKLFVEIISPVFVSDCEMTGIENGQGFWYVELEECVVFPNLESLKSFLV